MAASLRSIVLTLLPERCYDEFFVEFNYLNVECLKITLSKCLGIGIILGSILVKVPQIVKMCQAQSAKGINFCGILMELTAVSVGVAYSLANNFPFSAWGEGSFLLVQTTVIGALLLFFEASVFQMMAFLGSFSVVLCFLLSPYVPVGFLAALQAVNVPIIVISKMIQAFENYGNGGTGQLSAVTIFLMFGGSMARIFTSIQETGDSLIILTYSCASASNAVLAFQMVYYWNRQPSEKALKLE